jgi:hypothetical protein
MTRVLEERLVKGEVLRFALDDKGEVLRCAPDDKGEVLRFALDDKDFRYFSTFKRHHKTQLMMVDWIEVGVFVDVGEAIGIAHFRGNNNILETVFNT